MKNFLKSIFPVLSSSLVKIRVIRNPLNRKNNRTPIVPNFSRSSEFIKDDPPNQRCDNKTSDIAKALTPFKHGMYMINV